MTSSNNNESLMTSSDNQGKGERYDWLWMNMSSHVFFTKPTQQHNYDVTQLWRHVGNFGQLHRNSKGCKMWNINVHTLLCPKIFQIKHTKALGRIYFSTSNLHLRPLDPKNKIRIWVGFGKWLFWRKFRSNEFSTISQSGEYLRV